MSADTTTEDAGPPPAEPPPSSNNALTGLTTLIAALLVAVVVAVYTVIPQALSDIENSAAAPVTVANPVSEVTIANPVHEVIVVNPVDEVSVTNIVETASPRTASLWGYCVTYDDESYDIHVVAFSGGIEKTVAEGSYTADSASDIANEIADYYSVGGGLDFGDSSAACAHLDGWTQ